jgi:hypothetical protein
MIYAWIIVLTASPVLLFFLTGFALKTVAVLSYVLCPLKFLAFQKGLS